MNHLCKLLTKNVSIVNIVIWEQNCLPVISKTSRLLSWDIETFLIVAVSSKMLWARFPIYSVINSEINSLKQCLYFWKKNVREYKNIGYLIFGLPDHWDMYIHLYFSFTWSCSAKDLHYHHTDLVQYKLTKTLLLVFVYTIITR